MKTSLEHLPESKRAQLAAITALIQAEATVEMVILFGSHARGDWVDDPANVYFSDFDILIIVASETQARDLSLWSGVSERARVLSGRTPLSLIVHDIKEINGEIRLGQYFFVDILREGVELATSRRYQLATPKALEPRDRLALGLVNFRYWFGSASGFWRLCGQSAGQGMPAHAAFLLHQAVERYFHAVLLVYTGYKPKTHNIEDLAEQTAPLHPALAGALPRAEGEEKRLFQLLKKAYIEARYSKGYRRAWSPEIARSALPSRDGTLSASLAGVARPGDRARIPPGAGSHIDLASGPARAQKVADAAALQYSRPEQDRSPLHGARGATPARRARARRATGLFRGSRPAADGQDHHAAGAGEGALGGGALRGAASDV